jgi:hypothetical protein
VTQNDINNDNDGNIGMKKENSSVFFKIQIEERKSYSRNIKAYYSQGSTRIGSNVIFVLYCIVTWRQGSGIMTD